MILILQKTQGAKEENAGGWINDWRGEISEVRTCRKLPLQFPCTSIICIEIAIKRGNIDKAIVVDRRRRPFGLRSANAGTPLLVQVRHVSSINDILRGILPQVGRAEAKVIPSDIYSHSCVVGDMAYLSNCYDGMGTRGRFCRNANCLGDIAISIDGHRRQHFTRSAIPVEIDCFIGQETTSG